MNPKEPLWLPRGSVRALIAISLVAALIFSVVTSLDAKDVPLVLVAFMPIVAVVVNAYFEKRNLVNGKE
jgi:hypothetical protein